MSMLSSTLEIAKAECISTAFSAAGATSAPYEHLNFYDCTAQEPQLIICMRRAHGNIKSLVFGWPFLTSVSTTSLELLPYSGSQLRSLNLTYLDASYPSDYTNLLAPFFANCPLTDFGIEIHNYSLSLIGLIGVRIRDDALEEIIKGLKLMRSLDLSLSDGFSGKFLCVPFLLGVELQIEALALSGCYDLSQNGLGHFLLQLSQDDSSYRHLKKMVLPPAVGLWKSFDVLSDVGLVELELLSAQLTVASRFNI